MSTRPNAPQQPPVVPSRGNAGINAQTPLLLLPVHIQTRFVDSSAVNVLAARQSASELLVRIYPDQIAVNSHEPELTSQEVADGQAYWNALWQVETAPTNTDDLKAPWRVLASLYGSPRAAWIAPRADADESFGATGSSDAGWKHAGSGAGVSICDASG